MRRLLRGIFLIFFGWFVFSYAEPNQKVHISLNGFTAFGGIALGYSGGDDVSLRLKGLYWRDNSIEIKGGVRKFFKTKKPYGPFLEGGLGYIFSKTVDIPIPLIYLNVGYRLGKKFFVEGSLGFDALFLIFPLPKVEIGVGTSF